MEPQSSVELIMHSARPVLGAGPARAFALLLDALASAQSEEERIDAFVELLEWSRLGEESASARARVEALIKLAEDSPEVRDRYQQAVRAILSHTTGVSAFGEAGLPSDRGLIPEVTERLFARILPAPRDDHELGRLLERIFPTRGSVDQFASMPPDLFRRWAQAALSSEQSTTWGAIQIAFADGFRLLAARVQAQGLSEKLRKRSHPTRVSSSPFYRIEQTSEALITAWSNGGSAFASAWLKNAAQCRGEMEEISRRLEGDGVSVDVVYGLEVLEICLNRMELMAGVMDAPNENELYVRAHALLINLARASRRDHSIKALIRNNLRLLHRKIVDRSGETGEHYIAESRSAYRWIWVAAAGGGFLTAFTAAVKMALSHGGFPLFVGGFLNGINYAVSFLIMQACGFVLATKQPAMTAATLAAIVRERRGQERNDEVVTYIARICRSQVAAAIANVSVVFLTAFAFDRLWRFAFSRPYLADEDAQHVFHSLSPVDSGTIFFAALTGVLLYLGSLGGGWLENWAVYRRLPQAIREHRLGRSFGRDRMERFSKFFQHNISGWGTNITLGMLLGMTPAVGAFFGIPTEVRHVTLSTGTLALAAAGIHREMFDLSWFLWASAGIATMFVLNLSVSFMLSLMNAVRAYAVPAAEIRSLAWALWRRIAASPLEFLVPPRDKKEAAPAVENADSVSSMGAGR